MSSDAPTSLLSPSSSSYRLFILFTVLKQFLNLPLVALANKQTSKEPVPSEIQVKCCWRVKGAHFITTPPYSINTNCTTTINIIMKRKIQFLCIPSKMFNSTYNKNITSIFYTSAIK